MTPRRVMWLASAIVLLNLIDAVCTLIYTHAGLATEANPLMNVALGSPVRFMVTKISLVSLSVLLLWRNGHRRFAGVALMSTAMMYVALIGYHVAEMPRLIAQL